MASDLVIRFLGDTREFNAKLAETQAKMGEFAGKAETSGSSVFNKFGLVTVAAVGAVAVASLELADKFDVVHERLETATKAGGQNFDDFKGKVSDADKRMANLGFSAIDTEGSLAQLTVATHDVSKATNLVGLAADIARFKHVGLADATKILVNVEAGRLRVLAQLGISTKDVTGKTIDTKTALERLAAVTKDQATAYTHTLAGEFDVLKANVTNAGIALGEKLMPLLNGMIDGIKAGISGFSSFNASTDGFAGKVLAIGAVAPFAIAGITKIASVALAAGGALVAAAEDVYLWVLLNPQLAALAGIVAAAGVAFTIFGHHAHEAALAIQEVTDAELDLKVQNFVDTIDKINHQPMAPHLNLAALAMDGFNTALKQGLPAAQRYIDALARAGVNTDAERSALAKRVLAQKQSDDVQKKLTASTDKGALSAADAAAAVKAQAAAQKSLTESLDKYGKEAGPLAEKIVTSYHLSKQAVDDLTKTTQDFNSGIAKAFSAAADTVQAWTDKSKFNLKQFEADLLADTVAQANWSRNIAILSDAGINRGFLKTLIDAGPKSAKVLQGIVDGVSKGSVTAINTITAFGTSAATGAKHTVDANIAGLHGSFDNFARYVNGLHPHLDILITANGRQISSDQAGNVVAGNGLSLGGGLRVSSRAVGGPLAKGQVSWVGESGPELFVPDVAGTVIPNSAVGNRRAFATVGAGGGGDVVFNVAINNPTGNGREIADQLYAALFNGHNRQQIKQVLGIT